MSGVININYTSDYEIGTHTFDGDAGVNLKFVSIAETKFDDGIVVYDTGVSVSPELGYYTEVVARSSMSKTGWAIANAIGVIDAGYTGTIRVAVFRTVPNAPELKLGESYVQLIARKLIKIRAHRVSTLDVTERGSRGFGDGEKFVTSSVSGEKSKTKSENDATEHSAPKMRCRKNIPEKKPASVYFNENREKLVKQYPESKILSIFKIARDSYNALPDDEKRKYIDKAAEINAEKRAQAVIVDPLSPPRRYRRIVPVKPESVYFNENVDRFSKDHPDRESSDLFWIARAEYRNLSREQQMEYIDKAAKITAERPKQIEIVSSEQSSDSSSDETSGDSE